MRRDSSRLWDGEKDIRHARESGASRHVITKQGNRTWIPACAGMTGREANFQPTGVYVLMILIRMTSPATSAMHLPIAFMV